MLKKLPYPIAGLMLGLASLGNLLLSYGAGYRYALGILAAVLALALIAKAFAYPGDLRTALRTLPIAAVLPTFSMGVSLLTAYIRPYAPSLALAVWWSALFLHAVLLVSFTLRHAYPFNVKAVLPSWFIPYVGLGIFSITAPAFGLRPLGQALFFFALAAYFTLLPVVLYRLLVVKQIPAALLPTTAILVAPSSLTLVGYLASHPERNLALVYLLLACTAVSLVGVLGAMPRLLGLAFAPSFSAFTFPFVIAAIALKTANAFLNQAGHGIALLNSSIVMFEVWAVVMVCYVVYRYGVFLFSSPQVVKATAPTSR